MISLNFSINKQKVMIIRFNNMQKRNNNLKKPISKKIGLQISNNLEIQINQLRIHFSKEGIKVGAISQILVMKINNSNRILPIKKILISSNNNLNKCLIVKLLIFIFLRALISLKSSFITLKTG